LGSFQKLIKYNFLGNALKYDNILNLTFYAPESNTGFSKPDTEFWGGKGNN
jgi:hypothetical protein